MTEPFLPFCRPNITQQDIDAVTDVLRSGWITTGAKNADLEAAFCALTGAQHAVAMNSATAAMHCYLVALGIGPGDEVITPSMTWVSTINLITLLGATPVFVDVDRDTLMTTAQWIEPAITARTRLIIPVHFAGAPLDMDPIRALAQQRGIPVLEDSAHVLGSVYKGTAVGHSGDGIFSLQAIKNVTSAEGGVFVTDNADLAARMRRLKFHGLGVDSFDRVTQGRNPQAEVIEPGFKYNLPDMCAVLALSQMQRLAQINAKRAQLAQYYLDAFRDMPEIAPLGLPEWSHHHVWHLFVVRVTDQSPLPRDRFIEVLKQRGIGAGIHFRAVHEQKYYREKNESEKNERGNNQHPLPSLANTEFNSARICSLPLFPDMTLADAERVVSTIRDVLRSA